MPLSFDFFRSLLGTRHPVEVGDKINLWVHDFDATINLHDRLYGIREGQVEAGLRIEG